MLKDKFCLQSNTVHTFQREMHCDDTFRLLLKTLLKELLTNKGEIISEYGKNSQEYYARTRDKFGSNSPPFQGNVLIPPFPGTMHSQMPGVCPGGRRLSFNLTSTLVLKLVHLFCWKSRFHSFWLHSVSDWQ